MSQLLQQRHDDKESLKSLREEILSKKEGRQATTLPAYKEKAPGNILTTGSSYRPQRSPSSPSHNTISTYPRSPPPSSPNSDRYSFFDDDTRTPTTSTTSSTNNTTPRSRTQSTSRFTRPKSNSLSQHSSKEKERSDSSLVSEKSFFRRDDNASNSLSNSIDSRLRAAPNAPVPSQRSVSDSLVANKPTSLVQQPPPMSSSIQTSPTDSTIDEKERTSSIDSVMLNIPAAFEKVHKSSGETTDEDINKLIQASGSSDAVIRYLLKEKNSFTSQNAQLWRLVDKQRAMILGLNKDLERSLKEKERYRRKLKDILASTSPNFAPLPSDSDNGNRSPVLRSDSQTSHPETMVSPEPREPITHVHDELPPSPVDTTLVSYPLTPPSSDAGQKVTVSDNINESTFPTIMEEKEPERDPIQSALASLGGFNGERSDSRGPVSPTTQTGFAPPQMGLPADPPKDSLSTRKGPPAALKLAQQSSNNSRSLDAISSGEDDDDDDDESTLSLLEVDETLPVALSTLNVPSSSGYIRSPGLPMSPRPQEQTFSARGSSLASPALSARGFAGSMPLSPRPPRTPIMLPPNIVPSSNISQAPTGQNYESHPATPSDETDSKSLSMIDSSGQERVFRGLMSLEYPNLLLPPTALSQIQARVVSSRLKPSRASLMTPMRLDEDPVFTLAIVAKSDGHELWRIEKDSASLANLDQVLKQSARFTAKTPDRSLFSGHAPAKIDARRQALDTYLKELIETDFEVPLALELCHYLSSHVLSPNIDDLHAIQQGNITIANLGPGGRPTRNGYLTKRGKNFGGWKARFFVLDGPLLKYYEAPGGAHLGSIKLPNAEIGKQSQQQASAPEMEDVDHQYRHAFLIMEPKKKDSSVKVRHVLCAESDEERDQWVAALLTYVNYVSVEEAENKITQAQTRPQPRKVSSSSSSKKKIYGQNKVNSVPSIDEDQALKSVGYHDVAQGKIPARGANTNASGSPHPPRNEASATQAKAISAPKNATMIADGGAWGNKSIAPAAIPEDRKQRKRSFFGFGSKSRAVPEPDSGSTTNLMQMSYDQHGPIRPSFGAPLSEAVRYCHPANADVELPAVVYRCIEYLDAKNAASEEGIFRLSGSNIVIRGLRERFNTEGDINLITDEQYYDIHAVASLLKLYLRELPTTILTRELHLDFLAVTELEDVQDKVKTLNRLVAMLPACNASLLRCLASFLINIINHAEVNKMTIRNVGIVFSPTLNIPAPVFALFLQQYEGIFDEEPQVGRSQSEGVGGVV